MSTGNWTNINGYLQGDISYNIKKSLTTSSYVDIELTAFSQKWQYFDLAFEYRINNKEEWREDAVITQTTAQYLKNNKMYGIASSKYGETHLIQWKYADNGLLYSSVPQIRFRMLPRARIFGSSNNYYEISSLYGHKFVDIDGISTHKCLGINKDGKYICVTDDTLYILDSLSTVGIGTDYFSGLSNPNYVIQINDGSYIISDYGSNRILEIDSNLISIVKAYAMSGVVFLDYSEDNETLLITNQINNRIYEISWSPMGYGVLIWQSNCSLNSPQCATYKQNDVSNVVIADTNNARIVKYNRTTDSYDYLDYYRLYDGDSSIVHEISSFYKPFRVFQYDNDNICLIEQEGRIIDFTTIESSSSSSSTSSSSSSSSSTSSSSNSSSSTSSSSTSLSSTSSSSTSSPSSSSSFSSSSFSSSSSSSFSSSSSSTEIRSSSSSFSSSSSSTEIRSSSSTEVKSSSSSTSSSTELRSSSSSSSSLSSSSSSLDYSSSSTSSALKCCIERYCQGDICQYLSNWKVQGVSLEEHPDCLLYVQAWWNAGTLFIQVYADNLYVNLVAVGFGAFVGQTIELYEANSSGITGWVDWSAPYVQPFSVFGILSCGPMSSSTSSSSSSP